MVYGIGPELISFSCASSARKYPLSPKLCTTFDSKGPVRPMTTILMANLFPSSAS
jgi:hypothetical protein